MSTITVFGSASPREGSEEYIAAYNLGKCLAQSGYRVCNGGYGGTMEASARGAKDARGITLGVVAEIFGTNANRYIDQKIVVKTHVDRLLKLIELGDGYVVMRGGTGTLVELATVWEYINKGMLPARPVVVVGDYWKRVIETIRDELYREGRAAPANAITIAKSVEEAVSVLRQRITPS